MRKALGAAFNTLCGSSANEASPILSMPLTLARSFNTLCGSSANEASRRAGLGNRTRPFNTLCGSSANEAPISTAARPEVSGLSIPSAGRQPMKRYQASTAGYSNSSFNTLCGSSANEALLRAGRHQLLSRTFNTLCGSSANEAQHVKRARARACRFQYPLRVVSQ